MLLLPYRQQSAPGLANDAQSGERMFFMHPAVAKSAPPRPIATLAEIGRRKHMQDPPWLAEAACRIPPSQAAQAWKPYGPDASDTATKIGSLMAYSGP
jgi:hypothetical protein